MPSSSAPPPSSVDVLVVGGGPTGLTAASLLTTYGLSVALVEKNAGTSDEAKAISLDDESLRTLQVSGLDRAVYPIIVPGTGTRYYGADGEPLFHARGPRARRHGHPFKNPFAQPDLERALAAGLDSFDALSMHFGTEVVTLEQDADGVTATVRHGEQTSVVRARFVLGCDGGRSTVREILGIEMAGRSFPELWLVADTLEDAHDERYGMHVGDPDRPHVIVSGLNGRCRYEFKLKPGEAVAGSDPPFELVRDLVSRYRTLAPDQLERSVVYGFHAIIATRFRDRRCFLLGDAAHMMPPFAGQGLNSGVRDAMNLCWKVAAVVRGTAGAHLLDSYDTERRPHAQATIDLSVRLGEVAMTSSQHRARWRDLTVRLALRLPPTRRYLTEMRYRPGARVTAGFVAPSAEGRPPITGTTIPQSQVLDGRTNGVVRLDDVIGAHGTIVGIDVRDDDWARLEDVIDRSEHPRASDLFEGRIDVALDDRAPRSSRGRIGLADVDGALQDFFGPARRRFVLVRSDRLVAGVFVPEEARGVLDHLTALMRDDDPGVAPRRAHHSPTPTKEDH